MNPVSPATRLLRWSAGQLKRQPRLYRAACGLLERHPQLQQRLVALREGQPQPVHSPFAAGNSDQRALSAAVHSASADLAPADLVAMAYQLFFGRQVDPAGLASWQQEIDAGRFSTEALIQALCESPEYLMSRRIPFHEMVHRSRQAWIACLPRHARILDIGGSSPNIDQGAMIELGYRHRPEQLLIFDLPPDQQYWGRPKYPQDRPYQFDWGRLDYIHGQAEQIHQHQALADRWFDLIFMGQVIEHLHPEALPAVLAWIRDHLAPGGQFIFDTPNRRLTVLQIPDGYTDPDHKIEYTPEQLSAILAAAGLRVERAWGLLPMPGSAATGQFNPLETYDQPLLSDDPDQAYLFAFACVPGTAEAPASQPSEQDRGNHAG